MKRTVVAVLVVAALMLVGCSQDYYQARVPLNTSGYGYEIGDVVLLDIEKAPEIGDIVLYDAIANKSHCMAFGPGVYLAKIIGYRGNKVSFSEYSYEANGYLISFEREYESHGVIYKKAPISINVMWGSDGYEDVTGMELRVPENEYLADKFVGQECPPGEYDEHGSSIAYRRFTIKREAIKGVVLKKVGYDKALEELWKNLVY
jgi:hypothetical protein